MFLLRHRLKALANVNAILWHCPGTFRKAVKGSCCCSLRDVGKDLHTVRGCTRIRADDPEQTFTVSAMIAD